MSKLKELRERLFLSQEDLAKKAGIGASTINRLERGHQRPTFQTIRKLAAALEVNPGEIGFSEAMPNPQPSKRLFVLQQPAPTGDTKRD